MILEVSHRSTYRYSAPVAISHHLLHLGPRITPWQICRDHSIEIEPPPSVRSGADDYFGNPVDFVTIQQAHVRLAVHALSAVEIASRTIPDPATTPAWEDVAALLRQASSPAALEALEFVFGSTFVPLADEFRHYARQSFTPKRPILEAAGDLTRRIFQDFAYDPQATTTTTPVREAFSMKRGVCQDFAHVQLACLRSIGLAARYVSGYLLTRPPEGRERLTGADASHAWVSFWMPDAGWIDLDPTNDVLPDLDHVTLAWGRDYADVSPVSGVIFGGGDHDVQVAVDVVPVG